MHPAYRCFSFGIGSGASTHLVKGIAQAGLGTSEFITSGERMQPKVCACRTGVDCSVVLNGKNPHIVCPQMCENNRFHTTS